MKWLLGLLALAPVSMFAAWQVEEIEAGRRMGSSSLALDASGNPVIAYDTTGLHLAAWDGTTWNLSEVDSGDCSQEKTNPSLVLDASNRPALAYFDLLRNELRFARFDGATWHLETVDRFGRMPGASPSSLALDGTGTATIAYTDPDALELRLARRSGATWDIEVVDGGAFATSKQSLAFDPAGNVVICYRTVDTSELRLASWNGTGWRIEVVDGGGVSERCSVAFDTSGNPAVSYGRTRWNGSDSYVDLRFARRAATTWAVETVDSSDVDAEGGSLCFDLFGNPTIGYGTFDPVNYVGQVRLAVWSAGAWSLETLEYGADVSLAFDPGGIPILAYRGVTGSWPRFALKLGRRIGTRWEIEVVDEDIVLDRSSSLAFDAAGNPAISYGDADPGPVVGRLGLMIARHDGRKWARESVDSDMGWESNSLRFDAAGRPAISYCDDAHKKLKIARSDGPTWSIETLVDVEYDCTWTSLAFDAAGNPAISFRATRIARPDRPEVWFAHSDGLSWRVETIADAGTNGSKSSLAYDPAGNPAIAYAQGIPDHDLKLARWNGASWDIETVDAAGSVGQNCSLAFDRAGQPAISYLHHAPPTLFVRFARFDGTAWQIETVAEAGSQGGTGNEGTSLAFDTSGRPRIAFHHQWPILEPRVALWDGTSWQVETVDSQPESGHDPSLAFDRDGNAAVSYMAYCDASYRALRFARRIGTVVVLRETVDSVNPAWKAIALPLTSANDDETPPFPVSSPSPGTADDSLATGDPLVLYRALGPGDIPVGNVFRAVKTARATTLTF